MTWEGTPARAFCFTSPTDNVARVFASSPHGGQKGMSKTTIIARTCPDGTAVRVLDDGSEQAFPATPMRPMIDAQAHAAAMADPDARPMTDAEWQAAPKVPRTRTLRRALGSTQEEFAALFQIPLGTLRDWEQGKTEPDQAARAYLKVIAADAAAVLRALEAAPHRL
jgi:putative transcriptional regulator